MTAKPGHFPQIVQPRRSHASAASGTVGPTCCANSNGAPLLIASTARVLRRRHRRVAERVFFKQTKPAATANRKTCSSNGGFGKLDTVIPGTLACQQMTCVDGYYRYRTGGAA